MNKFKEGTLTVEYGGEIPRLPVDQGHMTSPNRKLFDRYNYSIKKNQPCQFEKKFVFSILKKYIAERRIL